MFSILSSTNKLKKCLAEDSTESIFFAGPTVLFLEIQVFQCHSSDHSNRGLEIKKTHRTAMLSRFLTCIVVFILILLVRKPWQINFIIFFWLRKYHLIGFGFWKVWIIVFKAFYVGTDTIATNIKNSVKIVDDILNRVSSFPVWHTVQGVLMIKSLKILQNRC